MKDDLHLHRALKYAADMKKLEEEKRLIILPCPPGETLYVIKSKCDADMVSDEECNEEDDCFICPYAKELIITEREATVDFLYLLLNGKGKFVLNENAFTEKEKAEKKLQELKSV